MIWGSIADDGNDVDMMFDGPGDRNWFFLASGGGVTAFL